MKTYLTVTNIDKEIVLDELIVGPATLSVVDVTVRVDWINMGVEMIQTRRKTTTIANEEPVRIIFRQGFWTAGDIIERVNAFGKRSIWFNEMKDGTIEISVAKGYEWAMTSWIGGEVGYCLWWEVGGSGEVVC